MSQALATYNRSYTTRSCRQQCYYKVGVASTENVLAAVSGDDHDVAQDFHKNNDDNVSLTYYKSLQKKIIGQRIQSVEDIEKWLRYTCESITNPMPNNKNNSKASLEGSLDEQLSEACDKELLTDIELTARNLNNDYDTILTKLQNDKAVSANEKDDEFVLQDLHLDDLILADEIPTALDLSQSFSDNSLYKEIEEVIKTAGSHIEAECATKDQQLKNRMTELTSNTKGVPLDVSLTTIIQDLSIENDSSDRSSDPSSCANIENEPFHANTNIHESEHLGPSVVDLKESKMYNTKSKSTNSSNFKPKFEPSIIKRKRKVSIQDNTIQNNEKITVSTSLVLDETSSSLRQTRGIDRTFTSKSPRSTSESSENDSDDLPKGRHPSFISEQELIISKALEESGITNEVLEYFYTKENFKVWRCHLKGCGRQFAKLCLLKVHLMNHLNLKPFKCDYPRCSWAFYSEFKLKRHKETHLNKKDYICQIPGCERRFTTIYNLASHEKSHTRSDKIVCQVTGCSAKFQTKRGLENHMKCHDKTLAPYVCNYENCGKRYYTSNALHSHQRIHNYSNKDLACTWPDCGKIFDLPCRKKAHMLQHTGQKPYACTFKGCSWAFSTSSKLQRHMKKHTKDRTFVCPEEGCNKAFMRSEHLKEHKLRHAQEMNFQCHHCSASFLAKSSLYFHMKNHENKDYVHKPLKRRNVNNTRAIITYVESSGSESTSAEENENISPSQKQVEKPNGNVVVKKQYKCPVESCSKWYSHRSSLRIHLQKHSSPSKIQGDIDFEPSDLALSEPNKGAARTEYTYEYVLNMKPDRKVTKSSDVNAAKISEELLLNEDPVSPYYQVDVGLPDYQIMLLDIAHADDILVLD